MKKNFISIVTPCFNEEPNVEKLYLEVSAIMKSLPYSYEYISFHLISAYIYFILIATIRVNIKGPP